MTAIFTALLLSGATSAYAQIAAPQCSSLWLIDHATVFENPNEVSVLVTIDDCNDLTQDDLFGYGALTDGTHVVGASHGGVNGFLDSAAQSNAQDPIPHNHLINLVAATNTPDDNDCFDQGGNFVVQSLSFESPGVAMFGGTKNTGIDDDEIKIWEVPKVFQARDALDLGAGSQTFTLGNLGLTPPVVSFHLSLSDDGVCVTEADSVDASLEDLIPKVGGLSMVIDSNALVLAGLQSTAMWMLPVVVGAAGIGAYFIKTRMNKE